MAYSTDPNGTTPNDSGMSPTQSASDPSGLGASPSMQAMLAGLQGMNFSPESIMGRVGQNFDAAGGVEEIGRQQAAQAGKETLAFYLNAAGGDQNLANQMRARDFLAGNDPLSAWSVMNPGKDLYSSPDSPLAATMKGTSFSEGFSRFLPILTSIMMPYLAPMLAGPLGAAGLSSGTASGLSQALISGAAGGASGGLKGAALSALGSGLGSLGGSALKSLGSGLTGGANTGSLIGGMGADALGAATPLSEVVVQGARLTPSLGNILGAAGGAAGGFAGLGGKTPTNVDFSGQTSGQDLANGAISGVTVGGGVPQTNVGGALGTGFKPAVTKDGVTTVDELNVVAPKKEPPITDMSGLVTGFSLPDLNTLKTIGNVTLDKPAQDQNQNQNQQQQQQQSQGQGQQRTLEQGFTPSAPSTSGGGGGMGGGGGVGGGGASDAFNTTFNLNSLFKDMQSFKPPPNLGNVSPFSGGGMGPSGPPGNLNLKGSSAPNIYPWVQNPES